MSDRKLYAVFAGDQFIPVNGRLVNGAPYQISERGDVFIMEAVTLVPGVGFKYQSIHVFGAEWTGFYGFDKQPCH
jgi:hypothetical protein